MNKPVTIVKNTALALGLVQLLLGLALWAGVDAIQPVHMAVGTLFVLSLWTLAVLAARAGVAIGLVVFAGVWGLLIPALGMTQKSILPGSAHWLVQAVHLAFGLIGLWLVTALATRAVKGTPATVDR